MGSGDAGGRAPAALTATDVHVRFGGVRALDGVTLTLARGEILGLIGPNGAGKTTIVNVLSGFQRPTSGSVAIDGVELSRRASHRFARAGIARTFQSGRGFPRLPVGENVEVAAVCAGAGRRQAREQAAELLALLDLSGYARARAESLPFGLTRRLEVARALACRPAFLLLDEPAAGLNEHEGRELAATIRLVRDRYACAVLLIEHDMAVVMDVCDRVHVLDHGRTLGIGTADEIRRDPAVVDAYLGS